MHLRSNSTNMAHVYVFRHLDIFVCVIILLLVHNSKCDFFSDLDKLDIDAKLRAIDDVITSINENDIKPSKKRKHKSDDTLGDAVEVLADMFGEECTYKCKNGNSPRAKPGHKPTSNGCGSYGIQFDVEELPGMDVCCDHHDHCYDTCNKDRTMCDKDFKTCLRKVCQKNQALGTAKISSKECKMAADMMYSGTVALGCDPYLKAQETACICTPPQSAKPVQERLTKDKKKGSQKFKNSKNEL